MEIKDIMQRLDASRANDGIKTASTTSSAAPEAPANPDALRDALRDAIAVTPSEIKTAENKAVDNNTSNPATDLLKLAEDLTSAEEDAMKKQAAVYGAAMCDGFMTRLGQYEDAALQTPQIKTAQAQSQTTTQDVDLNTIKTAATNDPAFQKFAEENPELVKEAIDLGYRQTWDGLVKTAEEDFNNGFNDTMTEIHKIASECYKQGAFTINNVLREMQNQAA